jgi:hypothetical protein
MKIDINEYFNLIYKIISNFPQEYRNELFNECYIQLELISRRFKPTLGNFQTFAYKRLFFHCKDFISTTSLMHQSLDEVIEINGEEMIKRIDLLESEDNVENNYINKDYIKLHNDNLTQIEKFIQQKYYEENISIKNIIKVYQPFHQIKSEQTIRKILRK